MINHLEALINIVLSTDSIEMPGESSMELLKGKHNLFSIFAYKIVELSHYYDFISELGFDTY